MLKFINRKLLQTSAAFMAGMLISSQPAFASSTANNFNNWGSIANNVTTSVAFVPGLLTALAYMAGIMMGVMGVFKIKDHVEAPGNTPLKDGTIRLAAGGALFSLPMIYEAMRNTTGTGVGAAVNPAILQKVIFAVSTQ